MFFKKQTEAQATEKKIEEHIRKVAPSAFQEYKTGEVELQRQRKFLQELHELLIYKHSKFNEVSGVLKLPLPDDVKTVLDLAKYEKELGYDAVYKDLLTHLKTWMGTAKEQKGNYEGMTQSGLSLGDFDDLKNAISEIEKQKGPSR